MGCGPLRNVNRSKAAIEEGRPFDETIAALRQRSSDPGNRQLFVFDFDLTIAKKHLWATYKTAPLQNVVINDETFVDLVAFRDFVRAVSDLGHPVAIATFGRKDVVTKAMDYALGDNHGLVISTPSDHGRDDGTSLGSKNLQLNALAKRYDVKLARITFFDDDETNVKEALKIGVRAVHTPSGVTKTVLSKAAQRLQD